MLLKNFTVSLCDLRLNKGKDDWKNHKACDQKSNNTQLKFSGADDFGREKTLNNQVRMKEESEEENEDTYVVEKARVVKKTVKILETDSEEEEEDSSFKEEEEDSSFEEEEEDSSFEDMKGKRKRKVEKYSRTSEIFPKFDAKTKKLSAYEQMIEKNRQERLAFLQSIKIEEAKAGLAEVVKAVQVTSVRKPVKRQYKEVERRKSPPVLRKSRRLAKCPADLSEEALYQNALKASSEAVESAKVIPSEMSFKDAMESADLYESYLADISVQESKSESKFCLYDKAMLKNMTVSESNIAKVTPARITALTWYPSPEHLIVAAGDKYGNLGIWNVDSSSNPYLFRIHLEGITNLQFSPFNPVNLISSCYDGILRCGDMVQHSFNEIYNVSDETCCTYFDVVTATTYLVAQKNGKVALVDKRTKSKSCEKQHTCHDYSIKTVNIHPLNRNIFVTAENKGSIRLWDLRKLQRDPVADITHHKRCVHSAFFSPVTGNSILATSTDDSVSIFDSTNLTSDIKLIKQMKHDNQTGRWLSIFRATWLPNSEEAFVIGSMQHPRRIEVYDKNLFHYNFMMHENLTTITSTNAFHPRKPALAGGNSSGKVFVFT